MDNTKQKGLKMVRSDDIGKKLIEVLGLPKETRRLGIILEAGKMAIIEGDFYIKPDQLESFYGVFENYKVNITEGVKNGSNK